VAGPLCRVVWDHSGINGNKEEMGRVLAWGIDMRLHDKCLSGHGHAALSEQVEKKCAVWGGEEQNNCIFQLEHSGKKRGMQC
jgi:hypothetical protein